MSLQRCTDLSAADWIIHPATPPWQLLTFGPDRFEASARLRYIPDPASPSQSEAEAGRPDDAPSDQAQMRTALRTLRGWTSTPEEIFFLVWLGDGSRAAIPPGPTAELPYREPCALFRGAVADLEPGASVLGEPAMPPAMIWPLDRAWCWASDVDPHWAGIGASSGAVDALVRTPGIDVVAADPRAEQPGYLR